MTLTGRQLPRQILETTPRQSTCYPKDCGPHLIYRKTGFGFKDEWRVPTLAPGFGRYSGRRSAPRYLAGLAGAAPSTANCRTAMSCCKVISKTSQFPQKGGRRQRSERLQPTVRPFRAPPIASMLANIASLARLARLATFE